MHRRTLRTAILPLVVAAASFAGEAVPEANPDRTYTVKRGDTMAELGRRLYGHRNFYLVIVLHNNVPDPSRIRVGLVLRVPDLKTLLAREGLCKVAEPEVDAILKARELFRRHERQLHLLSRNAERGRVTVPDAVAADLREAAKHADTAAAGLRTKKNVKATPKLMVGQLENLSRELKEVADGVSSSQGKNIDVAHQRFIYAICNGIKWARSGFN